MQLTFNARGTDSAKIIQVIETKSLAGNGTEENPARLVTQYWSLDGKLLIKFDTYEKETN